MQNQGFSYWATTTWKEFLEITGEILTGLTHKTLDVGLHLKSAWHFVQKNAANRNIYTTVRSEGDLMRNPHLYLKSRKIKWPSSGKSLKLVEGCNPNDFGRISSLSLA